MIGFLRGMVDDLRTDFVLLDVNGVGYRLFISEATRQKLHANDRVKLLTYMSVREDAIQLYGFYTQEEYDIFQLLISVSGIGPKVALGVLSHITVDGFCRAIHDKSTSTLTKLPGIGKKSAERLILELKDKISYNENDAGEEVIEAPSIVADDMLSEAEAALLSLGYTQGEIAPALKRAQKGATTSEVIKLALAYLAKA